MKRSIQIAVASALLVLAPTAAFAFGGLGSLGGAGNGLQTLGQTIAQEAMQETNQHKEDLQGKANIKTAQDQALVAAQKEGITSSYQDQFDACMTTGQQICASERGLLMDQVTETAPAGMNIPFAESDIMNSNGSGQVSSGEATSPVVAGSANGGSSSSGSPSLAMIPKPESVTPGKDSGKSGNGPNRLSYAADMGKGKRAKSKAESESVLDQIPVADVATEDRFLPSVKEANAVGLWDATRYIGVVTNPLPPKSLPKDEQNTVPGKTYQAFMRERTADISLAQQSMLTIALNNDPDVSTIDPTATGLTADAINAAAEGVNLFIDGLNSLLPKSAQINYTPGFVSNDMLLKNINASMFFNPKWYKSIASMGGSPASSGSPAANQSSSKSSSSGLSNIVSSVTNSINGAAHSLLPIIPGSSPTSSTSSAGIPAAPTAPTASTSSSGSSCNPNEWENNIYNENPQIIADVEAASKRTGVPAADIAAIMNNESGGGHIAPGGKNPKSSATGAMQCEDSCAEQVCQTYHYCPNGGTPSDDKLARPADNYRQNILQGAYLLRYCFQYKHATNSDVGICYNQGDLLSAARKRGAGYQAEFNSHLECPGKPVFGPVNNSGSSGSNSWSPQLAQWRLITNAQEIESLYREMRSAEEQQATSAVRLALAVREQHAVLEDLRDVASMGQGKN